MDAPSDIDLLIEEGLTLYGQGDLDGALLAWEQALSVDPENEQANSYVDYVRQNYELLTGDSANDEQKVPFGLDDEPYQIEILPGELLGASSSSLPSAAPVSSDLDEGWFMEEEKSEPRRAIDLEAEAEAEAETEQPAISFEDATREYPNKRPPVNAAVNDARAEFAEVDLTPGVSDAGFRDLPTNVKERDTGFVRPATGKPADRTKRPSQVPELKMTLRTPGDTADPFGGMELPTNDAPNAMSSSVSLSYDESPSAPRTDTANMPPAIRPPAVGAGPTVSSTTTQDFESQKTNAQMSKPASVDSTTPTRELPGATKPPAFDTNMVSAPTRDLGLRALNITDGEVTKSIKPVPAVGDGTKMDVILPFDPIDARSAQILDEIDEGAPDQEPKDERTRRRITALFERAVGWSNSGELDKSVASIDLALSEDPNSALGQKLIHRHRDMMMHVFQAFLGDLDRQPVLARPLHELANAPISPRAAFLLSRIDGSLTLDELLDVSGMPRIEAYRYLCQLFLRGILR